MKILDREPKRGDESEADFPADVISRLLKSN